MKLSHEALQTLYAQTDPAERARGALSADAVMGLESFLDDDAEVEDPETPDPETPDYE